MSAYAVLREVAPGAGGRPKSGGYDLVSYNATAPYLILGHGDDVFVMYERDEPRHDASVLAHLRAHGALVVQS